MELGKVNLQEQRVYLVVLPQDVFWFLYDIPRIERDFGVFAVDLENIQLSYIFYIAQKAFKLLRMRT